MNAETEIRSGERFGFGANWTRFLTVLDEARICDAENSLRRMLGVQTLRGRRFLDIGCGSGLFSLAARRLGAQVHSFDFDLQSVACAQELKRRYFPSDEMWQVEQGSILDRQFIDRLGFFDVVYSWGVLHHTGSMWVAIENAINRKNADVRTPIVPGLPTEGGLAGYLSAGTRTVATNPMPASKAESARGLEIRVRP